MSKLPTVQPELRRLIMEGLEAPYMSESCQDAIETGNHYQSVVLGEERTQGFRTARESFLDRIEFAGRTVLDLGSNLGELSREARRRGAVLADGFEYDPYFVELANLINAYNATTRVSFYRRDITDPSIYNEPYDIVLAFSVYVYIGPLIERVASIAQGVLVLETHRLDNDKVSRYIEEVSPFLSCHRLLGESEWGGAFPAEVKRSVLVFARDTRTLQTFVPQTPTGTVA